MSREVLNPDQFHQGRLFNPENPPLAFPKLDPQMVLNKKLARVEQLERMKRHNVAKARAR